ncbi:DUF881 domain-containing protein [Bacillus sp. FJAT-45037]|uniref:DUF881 domain-containing protein n=1 Tax=Bacillus sp. FJAT-45037 TaxID=2011007 RepID=UPI000C235D05|nr:DUF881 domain-containing protein [Bacillus sp. FJAT-45037]
MDRKWTFAFVAFIIGFMLAIQFKTTQEPVLRDTRDIRELRNEMEQERERQKQLTGDIQKTQELISQYAATSEENQDELLIVLNQQIESLRSEAGLTEARGPGIIVRIEPFYDEYSTSPMRRTPSPERFRYLINELNLYGATNISVAGERLITTSAFREVNGITHLNYRRLPPLPLELKVLTNDPEGLHNRMVVSESVDYFEIDGFLLTIEEAAELVLPGYDQTPRVRYMEEIKEG